MEEGGDPEGAKGRWQGTDNEYGGEVLREEVEKEKRGEGGGERWFGEDDRVYIMLCWLVDLQKNDDDSEKA